MKLAEALQERADLNTKISQLRSRIENNVLVQEGSAPAEDPEQLLHELDGAAERLEYLIRQINLSNCHYKIDGVTLTEMIAKKDVMRIRLGAWRGTVNQAMHTGVRTRSSEIRIISTIQVSQMQKRIDQLSRDLRLLDNQLQQANWSLDLLE